MSEAIQLIEKKLGEVRNQIQGIRSEADAYLRNAKATQQTLSLYMQREVQLKEALDKLKGI